MTSSGMLHGGGRRVFSLSLLQQISVQTLLRRPYSLRVQANVFRSVGTLKIPSIGSHTFV